MKENESKIKAIFPKEWMEVDKVNFLAIRFQFKLLGVDYRSEEEFAKILATMTTAGIIHLKNNWIRAGTETIFN